MKPTICLTILCLVAGLTACNSPETEKNEEPEVVEVPMPTSEEILAIIDQKNKEILKLYSEGKIDEAAAHFSDNVIQMPPNQPIINGIEEFKQRWKESAAMGTWDFDLRAKEVKSSGNLAVERGEFTLKFTPNEGAPIPPMTDEGNYLVLWELIDGDWKVVWDAPVSSVPMAMPE